MLAGVALWRVADNCADLLVSGLTAQAGGTQLAALQGQPGDFVGGDRSALVGVRQQAVVGQCQYWQVGL
ncbi:hypothetical protein D3C76_1615460 [compost metagenome]